MNETLAVRALMALAQVSRLQIFRELVAAGPQGLTPGELSVRLGIAPSALSFHLKELLHADMVSQQREGRHLIYRAALGEISALIGYLTDNCCQGQPCELIAVAGCDCP